jgi:transcriptional regulator with PAS, ATPase and Fis domain
VLKPSGAGGPLSRLTYLDTGDPQVANVIAKVRKVIGKDIPILITGETGTGKELLAQAIHNDSPRRTGSFVAVNCASIPETLIESELFGYEEGAFTGGRRKGAVGKLLQADGGTLFLDEIGDMPLALQAKLLRFLQERAVERVGGRELIQVDVRIIAATHRDLKVAIAEKSFREDLFYRISEVAVIIPPLRERASDSVLIANFLLQQACRRNSKPLLKLSPDAVGAIEQYPWPGNVRELEHAVERSVLLCRGDEIDPANLIITSTRTAAQSFDNMSIDEVEAMLIRKVLRRCDGNISQAAEALGLSRAALYRRIEKYGL